MTIQSSITVVCTALIAAGTLYVAGYYHGRDTSTSELNHLTSQIELITASQQNRSVIDFLADLKSYNENLFNFKSFADKIYNLETQLVEKNLDLENKNKDINRLEKTLKDTEETILSLKQEIQHLNSLVDERFKITSEFHITEGDSTALVGNGYILGVETIFSSWIVTNLGNKNVDLSVGEEHRFTTDASVCRLVLKKIAPKEKTAFFWLLCE